MMRNNAFWKFLMMGSLLGWVYLLYGSFFPFSGGILRGLWWGVLLLWGIGHPLELVLSLPIGKDKQIALEETIIKTILFGFTWWLPLKLGISDH